MSRRNDLQDFVERLRSTRTEHASSSRGSLLSSLGDTFNSLLRSRRIEPNRNIESARQRRSTRQREEERGMGGDEFYESFRHTIMPRSCGFGLEDDEEEEWINHQRRAHMRGRYSPPTDDDDDFKVELFPGRLPIPEFRIRPDKEYLDIQEIYNRKSSNIGIAIFIRGPPGSGKSYLGRLMLERERMYGNKSSIFISENDIHESSSSRYRRPMMDPYNENLAMKLRDEFKKGSYNFYAIELEGGSLQIIRRLQQMDSIEDKYQFFLVECRQPLEVLRKFARKRRRYQMAEATFEEMKRNPPPRNIQLVDPTWVYERIKPDKMMTLMMKSVQSRDYSNDAHIVDAKVDKIENPFDKLEIKEDFADLSTHLADIVKDPEILALLQSSVSVISLTEEDKASTEISRMETELLDNCPSLKPQIVYDYNHQSIPSLEDIIFTFQVRNVYNYSHRSTPRLKEIVKNINLDEIIAKRRATRVRSKVLWYLRNAEKPEHTVSTPKYPNNWEIAEAYNRPEAIGKRKKILNKKLLGLKNTFKKKRRNASRAKKSENLTPDEEMQT